MFSTLPSFKTLLQIVNLIELSSNNIFNEQTIIIKEKEIINNKKLKLKNDVNNFNHFNRTKTKFFLNIENDNDVPNDVFEFWNLILEHLNFTKKFRNNIIMTKENDFLSVIQNIIVNERKDFIKQMFNYEVDFLNSKNTIKNKIQSPENEVL